MAIQRELFLKILEDAYSAYYSIVPEENSELPLVFRADYNAQDEQYFFVKSAQIWKNQKLEYAYVFSAPTLDGATARRCMDWAVQDMLPKVKPHKDHQYTNCKVIFIVERADEELRSAVQKSKFSKSYGPLSLYGYTELLSAVVDLSTEKTTTNRVGQGLESFFRKLFALRHEEA